MNIYLSILIIILNASVFSMGQGPIILVSYLSKYKIIEEKEKPRYSRMIVVSITLAIISIYNICVAVLGPSESSSLNITYISLFFGIALVFTTGLSVYVIVEQVLKDLDDKRRSNIQRITTTLILVFAVFLIFIMVVVEDFLSMNHLSQAVGLYYPIMFAGMGIIGIICLFYSNKNDNLKTSHLILMISFIPLSIVDIVFLRKINFQTVSAGFGIFSIILFGDILKSVINKNSFIKKTKLSEFIDEFDLTDREAEVFVLASKGYSNQKICEELFVSINTVKNHIQKIYTKLSIRSRHELIEISEGIELSTDK